MEIFQHPGLKCTGNFFSKKLRPGIPQTLNISQQSYPWINPSSVDVSGSPQAEWVPGSVLTATNRGDTGIGTKQITSEVSEILFFWQWHLVNKTTTERSEKISRLKNAVPLQHVSKYVFYSRVFSSTQVVVVCIERHLRLCFLKYYMISKEGSKYNFKIKKPVDIFWFRKAHRYHMTLWK